MFLHNSNNYYTKVAFHKLIFFIMSFLCVTVKVHYDFIILAVTLTQKVSQNFLRPTSSANNFAILFAVLLPLPIIFSQLFLFASDKVLTMLVKKYKKKYHKNLSIKKVQSLLASPLKGL